MADFPMHKDHVTLEVLIDYVDGILDADTVSKMEAHLKENSEDQEIVDGILFYYETYGRDREGLVQYLKESKEGLFEALDAQWEGQTSPQKVRTLWYKLSKVAVLALLLAIPIFILLQQTRSVGDLVEEHLLEPYPMPTVTRGVVDENTSFWNQVSNTYHQEDYAGTITSLKSMIKEDNPPMMAHFYLGLSYLYLDKPQPHKAIPHLEKVATHENAFKEQAVWFLGLAQLQTDNTHLGTKTLKSVSGYKSEEAKKLLEKLK